ncbi:hypothetical protein VNO78_22175 [Psophocarpus tetragonolobus]|uniref:Uncharacterized protein n=1 Tax=Psophocarpus tetragonolobus TaxID=3891 RepID=A0AAN9SCY3_PSOTE
MRGLKRVGSETRIFLVSKSSATSNFEASRKKIDNNLGQGGGEDSEHHYIKKRVEKPKSPPGSFYES